MPDLPLLVESEDQRKRVERALRRGLRPVRGGEGIRVKDSDDGLVISLAGGSSGYNAPIPFALSGAFLARITEVDTSISGQRRYAWEEIAIAYNEADAIPTSLVKKSSDPWRVGSYTGISEGADRTAVPANSAWSLSELPAMNADTVTGINSRGSAAVVDDIVMMFEFRASLGDVRESEQIKYIFLSVKAAAGATVVRVKKTGGNAGSTTLDCSFVYSIYEYSDSGLVTALATTLTPQIPRFAKITYTAPIDGTPGLAYYTGTTWLLLQVFTEFPQLLICS